jgi:hypothetical protein
VAEVGLPPGTAPRSASQLRDETGSPRSCQSDGRIEVEVVTAARVCELDGVEDTLLAKFSQRIGGSQRSLDTAISG